MWDVCTCMYAEHESPPFGCVQVYYIHTSRSVCTCRVLGVGVHTCAVGGRVCVCSVCVHVLCMFPLLAQSWRAGRGVGTVQHREAGTLLAAAMRARALLESAFPVHCIAFPGQRFSLLLRQIALSTNNHIKYSGV